MEQARVDLAHEPDFAIGSLTVHPSTRELSSDGERQVIEPRVMQVLVALYRAGGAVVSKDDLVQSCWEGRVVGEDAINRVISRLRKVSDGIGKSAFNVETVTRVGYRMITRSDNALFNTEAKAPRGIASSTLGRRAAMAGAGVALLGAAGGWFLNSRRSAAPNELATMIDQAQAALNYYNAEQTAAAVGLLRETTRLYPESGAAWGKLAVAYHQQGWGNPRSDAKSIVADAEAAARRSLALDPGNKDAGVVLAVGGKSYFRNWVDYERMCRSTLKRFPNHQLIRRVCGAHFFSTGQVRQSLKLSEPLVKGPASSPQFMAMHAQKLWSVGRPDEARTMLDTAIAQWPRHYTLWFARHRVLTYSGKTQAAEAMIEDVNARPLGVPVEYYELFLATTRAVRSGAQKDVAAVLAKYDKLSLSKPDIGEEAALFASAAGKVDAAFRYLDWMYFGSEGSKQEGLGGHAGQLTFFLFEPPMKAVRADRRFDSLITRLDLKAFWRQAAITPDYLA